MPAGTAPLTHEPATTASRVPLSRGPVLSDPPATTSPVMAGLRRVTRGTPYRLNRSTPPRTSYTELLGSRAPQTEPRNIVFAAAEGVKGEDGCRRHVTTSAPADSVSIMFSICLNLRSVSVSLRNSYQWKNSVFREIWFIRVILSRFLTL
jgi:hypothetical protein